MNAPRGTPLQSALVLGAGGFVGRWIVQELAQRGVPTIAVVRDLRAAREIFRRWPAAPTLVTADLADAAAIRALLRDHPASHVFNLAGYGVARDETDEGTALQLNHALVTTLAEHGALGSVLVHIGSAGEYAREAGVLDEEAPPEPPRTMYGRTKLLGTVALRRIAQQRGLRAVCARLFTVYGDGEHDTRLLPALVRARHATERIPLSHGRQERDFAWIGDVAPALLALAEGAWPPGTIVNLASGRPATVQRFARAAARALGIAEERLAFGALPAREGDGGGVHASVARMCELLGHPLPDALDDRLAAAIHDLDRRGSS